MPTPPAPIMHILADISATPPPQALSDWLAVLFYIVGGATACVVLFKQLTGRSEQTVVTPQPLTVREHQDSVTRADLEKVDTNLHGRLKRERTEIDRIISEVKADGKDRTDKLERKLDENTRLTSEMSGEMKQMNQSMHTLTNSVTQFLQNAAHKG